MTWIDCNRGKQTVCHSSLSMATLKTVLRALYSCKKKHVLYVRNQKQIIFSFQRDSFRESYKSVRLLLHQKAPLQGCQPHTSSNMTSPDSNNKEPYRGVPSRPKSRVQWAVGGGGGGGGGGGEGRTSNTNRNNAKYFTYSCQQIRVYDK